jgi:transcription termination factor NusB
MTIKNGDLPAMPVEEGHLYQSRCDNGSWALGALGLTKREMFAMAAMQGLCASGPCAPYSVIVRDAVQLADALLAELESTK